MNQISTTVCPNCERRIRSNQSLPSGARLRCPACNHTWNYQPETYDLVATNRDACDLAGSPASGSPASAAISAELEPIRPTNVDFPSKNQVTVQTPHATTTVVVNLPNQHTGNALAMASLVLGIIGGLFCWVPYLGVLAVPFGLLAAVMGVIGLSIALVKKTSGLATSIAGLCLGLASVCVPLFTVAAIGNSISASKERQEAEKLWVPMGSLSTKGDISVKILTVQVKNVELINMGRSTLSRDQGLCVAIEITNTSTNRKHEYKSWAAGPGVELIDDLSKLTDNHGNSYNGIYFGLPSQVLGQVSRINDLYPGHRVFDLLLFEPPVASATNLRLELPAENVGQSGSLCFTIPIGEILARKKGQEQRVREQEVERARRDEQQRLQREERVAREAQRQREEREKAELARIEVEKQEIESQERDRREREAREEAARLAREEVSRTELLLHLSPFLNLRKKAPKPVDYESRLRLINQAPLYSQLEVQDLHGDFVVPSTTENREDWLRLLTTLRTENPDSLQTACRISRAYLLPVNTKGLLLGIESIGDSDTVQLLVTSGENKGRVYRLLALDVQVDNDTKIIYDDVISIPANTYKAANLMKPLIERRFFLLDCLPVGDAFKLTGKKHMIDSGNSLTILGEGSQAYAAASYEKFAKKRVIVLIPKTLVEIER